MRPLKSWFLPHDEDVLAHLRDHARTTQAVVQVVAAWGQGTVGHADAVASLRDLLEIELGRRRAVHAGVRGSFSTPLNPEDLLELAERLGEVTQCSYALVREAELSHTGPDLDLVTAIDAISKATGLIVESIGELPSADAATKADLGADCLEAAEHAYRSAIAALEDETDLRREIRRREVYRRVEHLSIATGRVAHRIWYAVYKSS